DLRHRRTGGGAAVDGLRRGAEARRPGPARAHPLRRDHPQCDGPRARAVDGAPPPPDRDVPGGDPRLRLGGGPRRGRAPRARRLRPARRSDRCTPGPSGARPHGDPIPTAEGRVELPDARLLSEVPTGTAVVVERISDADPRLLSFCAEHGITVGATLEVRTGPAFSDSLEVAVPGAPTRVPLGRSATDAIWVSTPA